MRAIFLELAFLRAVFRNMLSASTLIHAFGCLDARCRDRDCHKTLPLLVKMERHVRACGMNVCKICKLWMKLQKTLAQPNQVVWRADLHAQRLSIKKRHKQLMTLWRGIARCSYRFPQAQKRAAERAYTPGGLGFKAAFREFESLVTESSDRVAETGDETEPASKKGRLSHP